MAITYPNFSSSGSVRIEVEGGAAHIEYGSEFAKALQSIVTSVTSSISGISKEERPDQVSVTCGLLAIPSGGFAISLGTEKANFQVHLSWGKAKEGELPGLDIIPESSTTGPGESL
jgi:hypothetical protein